MSKAGGQADKDRRLLPLSASRHACKSSGHIDGLLCHGNTSCPPEARICRMPWVTLYAPAPYFMHKVASVVECGFAGSSVSGYIEKWAAPVGASSATTSIGGPSHLRNYNQRGSTSQPTELWTAWDQLHLHQSPPQGWTIQVRGIRGLQKLMPHCHQRSLPLMPIASTPPTPKLSADTCL